MSKNIFITGATGFLGGWLTEHFINKGYNVEVSINSSSSSSKNKLSKYYIKNLGERCTERQIDLTKSDDVAKWISEGKPSAIIHTAAISDITVCHKNPVLAFNASALSSLNILEAIRQQNTNILLLSHTTDKVYSGNPVPFNENMSMTPKHIYEIGKVTQEYLNTCYANYYKIKVITIRCGNYFGGYDFNFNRIIPYAISQNIKGEVIELRSAGNFTRDFLYIEDAVLLNQLLLDKLFTEDSNIIGEAFNFSLEIQMTVLEIIELISKLMNIKSRIKINNTAKAEIPDMRLSCDKAKKILNWKACYSFEEGLIKSIEFYKQYLKN